MSANHLALRAPPKQALTVRVATLRLDSVELETTEARCGDFVTLIARLNGSGSDGVVLFEVRDARSDKLLEMVPAAIEGRQTVRARWCCKKPVDQWTADPDVKVSASLVTSSGKPIGDPMQGRNRLRIVRPANGKWRDVIPNGTVRCVLWTQTGPNKSWERKKTMDPPANFDIEHKDGVIVFTTQLRARGLKLYVPSADDKRKWKKDIEEHWNGHYDAHRDHCMRDEQCDCTFACCRYKVLLRWEFVDSHAHIDIDINPGECKGDPDSDDWWWETNWYQYTTHPRDAVASNARAHEAGHCAGHGDDYRGGILPIGMDPNGFDFPDDSVMSCQGGRRAKRHHLRFWLSWAGLYLRDRLVPIPTADNSDDRPADEPDWLKPRSRAATRSKRRRR